MPRFVVDELRGYLRCGVLAHGAVRFACSACGTDPAGGPLVQGPRLLPPLHRQTYDRDRQALGAWSVRRDMLRGRAERFAVTVRAASATLETCGSSIFPDGWSMT
jgi:hypothetical protein